MGVYGSRGTGLCRELSTIALAIGIAAGGSATATAQDQGGAARLGEIKEESRLAATEDIRPGGLPHPGPANSEARRVARRDFYRAPGQRSPSTRPPGCPDFA